MNVSARVLGTAVVLSLFATATPNAGASPETDFARANEAYAAGDYGAAATQFEAILESGVVSAALLYDLANAESKGGRVGAAVLHYERALALAPRDPDILANLRQTRAAANLVEPERDRWQSLAALLTVDGWGWLAALALWSGCGLLVAHALRKDEARRPSRGLVAGVLVSAVVLVVATALSATRLAELNRAVVLGPAPALRVAPFDAATITTELVAGQLVDIERTHETFSLVRTTDGQAGWMPSTEVREILAP